MYMFDDNGDCTMLSDTINEHADHVEEISSLDMDLLTVLARIHQSRNMIMMIDDAARRILETDCPRLASHISDAGIQFSRDTELDTGFTTWLVEIRQSYREALAEGRHL